MKLSEAIRLGCQDTRKGTGVYVDGVYACALGAAAIGSGLADETTLCIEAFEEMWPELGAEVLIVACPKCGDTNDLFVAITHINDDHGWTREAIADWLDSISIELPVTVRTAVPA